VPFLSIKNLLKRFDLGGAPFARQSVTAIDDISFDIARGEVFGLVGESGSGKSTVGLNLLRLQRPTGGQILFDGTDIARLPERTLRPMRKRMQMVFQDPFASLNAYMRIGDAITEPMLAHRLARTRKEARERAAALVKKVGLPVDAVDRFPHEFSGGQRQRIAIARALASEPEFLVADEPTSALDVSVRAQIVEQLAQLRDETNLTILLISHDLALVGYIADRIGVMYLGRLVEVGTAEQIMNAPRHPYTKALIGAVPRISTGRVDTWSAPAGEVPSPINLPPGCSFAGRCPLATAECRTGKPPLLDMGGGHQVACVLEHKNLVH
jgi:oligopeptide transport system ATP-binding protein